MAVVTVAKTVRPAKGPVDRSDLRNQIVRHLAEVRCVDPVDISGADDDADVPMTDKEAKEVLVSLEQDYECDRMFSPSDLFRKPQVSTGSGSKDPKPGGCVDPAQDTSVGRLVDIVAGKFGI